MYLVIFSTTTMLLSIIMPIATTIDINVKTFIVKPATIIVISAINKEKGIAKLIIKLDSKLSKTTILLLSHIAHPIKEFQ